MQDFLNKIICGDCIKVLDKIDEPFANLVFADPPFNIGYKYDKYNDRVARGKYVVWTRQWMRACCKALKPEGSFYIAIGDDYVAYVRRLADRLNLHLRNWIIWHYTFGQQTKDKFARSHTHILYFVKDKDNFVFNTQEVRVISDRQKKYNDKRANPEGKMPDDVWNEYPRICGTFDERSESHPCQMPESLLARIIRVSSRKGDWILDPFSGSGTTAIVAAKLQRNYTGIEISKDYAQESRERIRQYQFFEVEGEGANKWNSHLDVELKWLYHENKVPDGQLAKNKTLLALFAAKFNSRIAQFNCYYTPEDIVIRLERLRKSGKLGPLRGQFNDEM